MEIDRKSINDLKILLPFVPLIITFVLLILKPYYIFPTESDLDFHLVRARDILENPNVGIFWNYLVYYPQGSALWHPPLFHLLYASLWWVGGVRFAHSFLCVLQILLTVGVASWIANKEYGIIAGFFSGMFALAAPLPDTLLVSMPATYIPILTVLTIYLLPKDKIKAFFTSFLGLWIHIIGLIVFIPLFLVDGYKKRKNLKMIALLLPSWFFWVGYFIYFKDRTGATNQLNPSFHFFSLVQFSWFNLSFGIWKYWALFIV